jgi:hypothetical protein
MYCVEFVVEKSTLLTHNNFLWSVSAHSSPYNYLMRGNFHLQLVYRYLILYKQQFSIAKNSFWTV